ncbi:MAG: methylmalonyl-CoA mutase family protein, partial [Marinirhabdus sp.]|nr:methylmalonyl-CoA mutase family protein [Marinirhabdus sp.]
MSRKNLEHLNLKNDFKSAALEVESQNMEYDTAEKISVKKEYTAEDSNKLEHLNFVAGIAPNLRGPYSTMYVRRPWTIRQY